MLGSVNGQEASRNGQSLELGDGVNRKAPAVGGRRVDVLQDGIRKVEGLRRTNAGRYGTPPYGKPPGMTILGQYLYSRPLALHQTIRLVVLFVLF